MLSLFHVKIEPTEFCYNYIRPLTFVLQDTGIELEL